MPETKTSRDPRLVAIGVSLSVSLLMLVGKTAAYLVTGSAAIFSDAAESVIHVLATCFVAYSLWYAVQPADEGHPYGHGKMAYLSAGFEGGLIAVAALVILYRAVLDLVQAPPLQRLGTGLILLGALTAVNLLLGLYLVRAGRRHNNLVLVSNGQHVLTDMWTSLGVIVGLGLVWLTGLRWVDPVVAILVAANILWTALRLLRRSFEGLMDRADPRITQAVLSELERAVRARLISGYHQLRHRRVQDQVWIEYHLLFPEALTVTEAHARSHAVEDAIAALFEGEEVYVTAHLEPERHDEAHPHGHNEPDDPLREIGVDK